MMHAFPERRLSMPPNGFTLFEVILALALFVASMASLSQLMTVGLRASAQAQVRSRAAILCETKLNEVVAGVLPLNSVQGQPLEGITEEGWTYSVVVQESDYPGLLMLAVTVEYESEQSQGNASVTVWRFLRDPSLFLESSTTTTTSSSGATQ